MIDLGNLGDLGIQFFGLNDNDRIGAGFSGTDGIGGGDFNGDGIADLFIGALASQTDSVSTGGGYVVLGSTDGIDTDLSNAFLTFHGVDNSAAGVGMAGAGDVNGDGFDDLLIGDGDAAYVVFGRDAAPAANLDLGALGLNGFAINASSSDDSFGYTVARAGDIDGDGLDDVLVGAATDNPNGDSSGAAYLIFGRTAFSPIDVASLGSDGVPFLGASADLRAGEFVATGDINGDGLTDFLIGTTSATSRVSIVFGTDPAISSAATIGNDAASNIDLSFGVLGIPAVGDFDGDGQDDVIIGALNATYGGTGSGAVFGVAGPVAGDTTLGANDLLLRGDDAGQYFGSRLANLGDVNGDGIDDLIIGSRNEQAVVLFGAPDFFTPGTAEPITDVDAIAPTRGFVINGAAPQLREGLHVAGPGDVNGDGLNDILVAADYSATAPERVSLIYGAFAASSTDGADSLTSGFQADSIAGAGGDDTIFGNGGDDTLLGNAGADLLAGGDDNDSIGGGAGADNGYGQDGDDTLAGGDGNDNLRGNQGSDMLLGEGDDDTLRGHLDDDTLIGDTGNDLLFGGAANDSVSGGLGADTLNGNSGNDTIFGGDGNDLLRGQGGADSLLGGVGDDTVRGMQGFDVLLGEGGDDLLSGGAADDTLTGGAGADIFEFAQGQGGDTVTDFDVSEDLLSIVGFGFADLVITDSGDGARITIAAEGDSPTLAVLLNGVAAADLNADLFVGG